MLSSVRPFASRLLAALAVAACGGSDTPTGPGPGGSLPAGRPRLAPEYRPTGRAAAGDVFVHLFEWRWNDIATECEAVLGPAGYKAVQVSPPQEHAVVSGNPWWQRYQPVSYSIDRSRSGTRAEFQAMVTRCRAVGVDIYVDAVINHMTGNASGTGSNGTVYTKYNYPGLYTQADFHPPCGVDNYQSAVIVQDCELVGLADLNTGLPSVRQKIADYLVGLSRLGVAGFRIDAAKHMQPVQLDSIVSLVNRTLANEGRARPYWFAEVIDYGGEGVATTDYLGLGYASGGAADVTEFKYRGIGDKFINKNNQRVSELKEFSPTNWGVMPSDKAVVFIENHDTQRDGEQARGDIWYRDGQVLRLAHVWLLGYPYGYPSVMSSYAFTRGTPGRDVGPPSSGAGETNPVSCAPRLEDAVIGQWVCEHRDPTIARMVGFRRATAGTTATIRWDDGANAIAFSRGDRGFVIINRNAAAVRVATTTGLAAGGYCDVLAGGRGGAGGCAGTRVDVAAGGTVDLQVPALTAVVLQAGVQP
jgi:alpha-amylase